MKYSKVVHGVIFILAATLLGCAQKAPEPPVPPLNLNASLVDVYAHFETARVHAEQKTEEHVSHQHGDPQGKYSNEWQFWRSKARVEMLIPAQKTGEVWMQDKNMVFYQKVFHADKKIVEYQSADLESLNVPVQWRTNELMIAPDVLLALKIKNSRWQDGAPVLSLQGRIDGIDYEVDWRTDLNLPLYLSKTDAAGNRETTRLLEATPLAQGPAAPDNRAYEIIDFADLGDRERDPFVIKIQNQLPGGEHAHVH